MGTPKYQNVIIVISFIFNQAKKMLAELEEEDERLKHELELTERKITNRKSNSPKYFERLWEQAEDLKLSISKMQDHKDGQVRQVNRLMKGVQDLITNIVQLEKESQVQIANVS